MNWKWLVFILLGIGITKSDLVARAECGYFEKLLIEGDRFLQAGNHYGAIQKYLAASADCREQLPQALKRIEQVINILQGIQNELRQREEDLTRQIGAHKEMSHKRDSLLHLHQFLFDSLTDEIERRTHIQNAIEEMEQQYRGLGRELSSAGKTISLTTKRVDGDIKYFYIDTSGTKIDRLGVWDFATDFQEDGYADVEQAGKKYKIDTLGRQKSMSAKILSGNGSFDCHAENRKKLPFRVFKSDSLEILIAKDNDIHFVPTRIRQLTKLHDVNLANNRLYRMRTLTFVTSLKRLVLQHNEIHEIQKGIANLQNLKDLDLSYNYIARLPIDFFQLSQLEFLNLEYNNLRSLRGIEHFSKLKFLELSYNQLRGLPAEIVELQNLEYLGLTGNNILGTKDDCFFKQLIQLKHLKVLRLGDNPCSRESGERYDIRKFLKIHLPNCRVVFN